MCPSHEVYWHPVAASQVHPAGLMGGNWGSSGFSVLPCDPVEIPSLRPPCFADYDSSLTLPRHAREDAHQGGSGAWTLRTYPPPVPHPNHVACTGDVLRRRFMGRTPWKTAHKRIGFGSPPALFRRWEPSQTRCIAFGVPFLRKESDAGLRLLDSGLLRLCPVSSHSGHV